MADSPTRAPELPDEAAEQAPEVRHFEVGREHKGLSLFDFLDAVAGPLDRKQVLALAHGRRVLINGEPVSVTAALRVGDFIELAHNPTELLRHSPTRLNVLHEVPGLVVVDKPAGMPFSESRRGGDSAMDFLSRSWPGARAVHRLDKETSGVVVAALGRASAERLGEAFADGSARVEYIAIARGTAASVPERIDVPLGKRRKGDVRLVPDFDRGTPCATSLRLEEELRGFVILRLRPEGGGRSHQVRAHLAAAGLPTLCDQLYGEDDRLLLSQLKLEYRSKRGRPERPILARPALHAERFTWAELCVTSPMPEDLNVLLAQLRRLRPPA